MSASSRSVRSRITGRTVQRGSADCSSGLQDRPRARPAVAAACRWRTIFLGWTLIGLAGPAVPAAEIVIGGNDPGRVFEGIGALSAGASSRLLIDYPEPQRSEILDYLFKAYFGAALQHLKVEIGGDVNSTAGTEPSYARTRDEYDHPRPEYFQRGWEWWLMREARARNPRIALDVLQWGAPWWIGEGTTPPVNPNTRPYEELRDLQAKRFYSQDNADFIAGFIQAARRHHGLDIDYCGIWNETPYDCEWIKLLRKTLDARGLREVKIVAADQTGRHPWEIARDMRRDPALADSIHAIGAHYAGMLVKDEFGDDQYDSSPEAKQSGKPLWASEDGPWRGDWSGARTLAKIYNRNYIRGKMTRTIVWSLVTAYYENLPVPDSGLMKANAPWCGHYEVQPALWATAHTTQFAQPGWRYLDTGCGLLENEGSYVTLRAPGEGGDYSIIVETVDAAVPQALTVHRGRGLSDAPVHVWRSNEASQFEQLQDITPAGGRFTVTLEPGSIYSLTTTTGQMKGRTEIPPFRPIPLPWREDFESTPVHGMPRFFADQGGVFEVVNRSDGQGRCLRQVIATKGIEWIFHPEPEPYTVMGSTQWRNYTVRCVVRIGAASRSIAETGDPASPAHEAERMSAPPAPEPPGHSGAPPSATLYARVNFCPQDARPPHAYALRLDAAGAWELRWHATVLASGRLDIDPGQWHRLALSCRDTTIAASINDREVARVASAVYGIGMIGLGCSREGAEFDDLVIEPLPDTPWCNLARCARASASSEWDGRYAAGMAVDGNESTRWNAGRGTGTPEWIELRWPGPVRCRHVFLRQNWPRIRAYDVQYHDGTQWITVARRTDNHELSTFDSFDTAQADRLRLLIQESTDSPAICEIDVPGDPDCRFDPVADGREDRPSRVETRSCRFP